MRIYDKSTDKAITNIVLFLKPEEAQEVVDALEDLLSSEENYHSHISDAEYKKEITICLYDEKNLSSFNERAKKLILDDE